MGNLPHFGELQPVHSSCKHIPIFPFNFVSKTIVTKNSVVVFQNDTYCTSEFKKQTRTQEVYIRVAFASLIWMCFGGGGSN